MKRDGAAVKGGIEGRPVRRAAWMHAAAAAVLAGFALALFAPLLFTNRAPASGDILYYFYPYRDYAAEAVRQGRVPLWNPYIFTGAPFLANPQAAALYPLHWPLSWLPVTKQIAWSAALHTWLLGLGGYALLRRWGQSWTAGVVGGLALCGSGFYGGLYGHINQMNGAAWLPWLLLALDARGACRGKPLRGRMWWSAVLGRGAAAGLLVALMVLAGHTQTAYINLFGAGVWLLWPLAGRELRRTWRSGAAWRERAADALPGLAAYALGLALGALLSGAQLLPTIELSGLGLRSGGLSYGEVSSFSLKPLKLLWTLLPSYGLADLSVVFATPGYSEYVAYVGAAGLLLAALGAWRGEGQARTAGLFFAGLGLILALGRWNPAYYVLYWVAPGFDLFRAPARWMMLYTLGAALLAGCGAERILMHQRVLARGYGKWAGAALIVLVAGELALAARSLPHAQPTAPQAVYGVRTAPAHLLTDPARGLHPAAAGRFLSMSTASFEPGDKGDYRRVFVESDLPQLDERAFQQLVYAQKDQEILAPNLSLFWRVPAVDGFDGGVLPLQRYLRLLALFIPAAEMWGDGRLREQVQEMPQAALLGLFNTQYVITDKVRDLWVDGVYYDRQIGARLAEGGLTALEVMAPEAFTATEMHVVGALDLTAEEAEALAQESMPVARLEVAGEVFTLTGGGGAGAHFAADRLDSPLAESSGTRVVYRDVEGGRQEYLARFALAGPADPDAVRIELVAGAPALVVQAVTLVDGRTGMFQSLLPSDRGRFAPAHSGDVKVYENLDVLPRAYLVEEWSAASSVDDALAQVAAALAADERPAVVEGADASAVDGGIGDGATTAEATAEIVAYEPERIVVRTASAGPAMLVVSDAFYPGWQAAVDGADAPVYAANVLFRGVPTPAGEHTVVLTFAPASWRQGLRLTGVGVLAWIGCLLAAGWLRWGLRAGQEAV